MISGTQPLPQVNSANPHTGKYAALLGTLGVLTSGESSIYQEVTVPPAGARLHFWYWPASTVYQGAEPSVETQAVYVADTQGRPLAVILDTNEDDRQWKQGPGFDLSPWAGQTVRVVFSVTQDAPYGVAALYVDDVTLQPPCATDTPTSTPSLTNTPTPTTICLTPTPLLWPWGVSVTPTPGTVPALGTLGIGTKSYYIDPTYTPGLEPTPQGGYFYNAGWNQADHMVTGGPLIGVIVLDFGMPWFKNVGPTPSADDWGTIIFHGQSYVAGSSIEDAVAAFAKGFADRAQQSPSLHQPFIYLAAGTSNDLWDAPEPTRTALAGNYGRHGAHWGNMINFLNDKYRSLSTWVLFEGADDIEFGWSASEYPMHWREGYSDAVSTSDTGVHVYYDYGSCDACYPPGDPNDLSRCASPASPGGPVAVPTYCWHMDKIVSVSGVSPAQPLPQIYYPSLTPTSSQTNQSAEWAWLDSYAATHDICLPDYNIAHLAARMYFPGLTAGYGSSSLPANLAWQKLWTALDSISVTLPQPGELPFVTTIGYHLPARQGEPPP